MSEQRPSSMDDLLKHGDAVRAMARSLLRGREADADDLSQEVWLRSLKTSRGPLSQPRAWLRRVTGNAMREERRRDERRTFHERRLDLKVTLATDELVERAESHRRLIRMILDLEERERRIVLLRYFEGLKSHEIAEREGMPASSVRGILERSLDRLRGRLQREEGSNWRHVPLVALAWPYTTTAATLLGGLIVTTKTKIAASLFALILMCLAGTLFLESMKDEETRLASESEPMAADETRVSRTEGEGGNEEGATPDESANIKIEESSAAWPDAQGHRRVVVLTVPREAEVAGLRLGLENSESGETSTHTVSEASDFRAPLGRYKLKVFDEGWRVDREVLEVRDEGRSTLWLLRKNALHLRVLDPRFVGIENAELRWLPTAHLQTDDEIDIAPIRTDRDGRARIPVLEPAGTLEIRASGFRLETRELLSVPDDVLTVILQPRDGRERSIRVLDRESREPLEGARGRNLSSGAAIGSASDASGALVIDAHIGFGRDIVVSHPGHLPHRCGPRDLVDRKDLELPPLAEVELRVVDERGAQLQSAEVFVVGIDDEGYASDVGFLAGSRTDEDGIALLKLPRGLELTVAAQTEDGRLGAETLVVDEKTDSIRISLGDDDDVLRVRVEDEVGAVVRAARVRAQWQGQGLGRSRTVGVDARGEVVLPVPEQLEHLIIQAPGFATQRFERAHASDVQAGGSLRVVLVEGQTLRGRLVCESGEPVPGLEVQVWAGNRISREDIELEAPPETDHPLWTPDFPPPVRTIAAADGSFEARGLSSGRVQVAVELPRIVDPSRSSAHDSSLIEVTLPHHEELLCVVSPLRFVALDVIDAETGLAILDFRIARNPGGVRSLDEHTRAHWEGYVPVATKSLALTAKGYRSLELTLEEGAEPVRLVARMNRALPQRLVFEGAVAEVKGRMISVFVLQPQVDAAGQTHLLVAWNDAFTVGQNGEAELSIAFPAGAPVAIGAFEVEGKRYAFEPEQIVWEPGTTTRLRVVAR